MNDLDQVLARQRTYYARRAPVHEAGAAEWFAPVLPQLLELMRQSPVSGEVLELACGTGYMTAPLSELARSVDAVDSSAEMLALLDQRHLPNVTAIQVDVFAWRPRRRWDAIFMSNFLAHVPPARLEAFWATLAAALRPGGRVIVVDSTPIERWNESDVFERDALPLVRREVDGEDFDIVRVFWEPAQLLALLEPWGWRGTATVVGAGIGRGVAFYNIGRVN